jgi:uncharacterized protein (TIGR02996 family)
MSLFAREPAIEARLLDHRDDVREWAVYADWLEANGSPRGALASLMVRREATPTVALADALKVQAQVLADLTPEPLKTLATRGAPEFAPVFRRGFIHSAGALDATDFEALATHPSCALLDLAYLGPGFLEWLPSAKAPLPWREVVLRFDAPGGELALAPLFAAAPRLESLVLSGRAMPDQLELRGGALRALRLDGGSPQLLRSALVARLPTLKRVEVRLTRDVYAERDTTADDFVDELLPFWKQLDEVVLEGLPGESTRRALAGTARPERVVVRSLAPSVEVPTVHLQLEPETAFFVMNRALTAADESAIAAYARLAGVTRLVLHVATLKLAQRALTLVRLHGAGEAPLVPRVVVQQLVKTDRALDALALTSSSSNDATSAWSFGPHLAQADTKKNVIPVRRRDEGRYTRDQMVRELIDALIGFDPGLEVYDALECAFDGATVRTLLGEPPQRGERVKLFTDLEDRSRPEEDEEDDDGIEADPIDIANGVDPDEYDEDSYEYESGDDSADSANEWGAEPENVPDFGPPDPPPVLEAVTLELPALPGAVAPQPASPLEVLLAEDGPDDDLDAPLHDAYDADAEEVWTQGPVDLPEHHRGPIGETFDDPDEGALEVPGLSAASDVAPCAHCHQPRELQRCATCRDEVCRECAGTKSALAWEEGRDFHCAQCTPRSGKYIAVRKR